MTARPKPREPRRAAPRRVRGFCVLAAALGLGWLGCDDETGVAGGGTTAPTAWPATTSAPSTTGSEAAGAPSSTTARPDAAALTDGPPEPSATVSPAPTTRASANPSARPSTVPSAGPSTPPSALALGPSPTTTASLDPSATPVELPGVDPDTLPPPEPGSADEMASRIDEIYQPIVRFQARFEQTYRAKVAGVTKRSKGLLVVERPAKLSMRYDPPNDNRVVSDGRIVKVYEADNKQMYQQSVARTEYPGALAFVMGRGLRASFSFSFHDQAEFKGGRVLAGRPRVHNPAYEKAFFYIDSGLLDRRDPRAMRRVLVLDVQQNRNRFDFTDIQQPSRIDPAEFTFTPPPGTTVLK